MKDNHACFSCLKRTGKDHRLSSCSRRRQCTEKSNGIQCTYYHHPLLHAAFQSAVATIASATSNKRTLLPIVQVDLLGSGSREKIGNALLDSGAQISLIRTPIAEELRLKGKEPVITITKVGGQEEELSTKTYQVRIRSLENHTPYTIQAIGIPWISDEISKVRVDDIARKLGLNKEQLHRGFGTADLLIGIDQAKFHVGETREAGDLVARHTPLGWVIFGATPNQKLQECQVYHVKLETPIDLTSFWTRRAWACPSSLAAATLEN